MGCHCLLRPTPHRPLRTAAAQPGCQRFPRPERTREPSQTRAGRKRCSSPRGSVGAARPMAARRGKPPAVPRSTGTRAGFSVPGGSCGRRLCLGLSLHNSHPLSYLLWSPNSGLRFWTSSPSAQASGLSEWGGRVMVHQTTLGIHRRPWNRYTGSSGDKKMGSSGI